MITACAQHPLSLTGLARLALLSLLLLATACSTLTGSKPAPIAEFAANAAIQQWQLRGKMGIRSSNKANSAYLNWQQCGQHFDIRLSGPLGQSAAHLYGDNHSVTLTGSEQQPVTAKDPEQLLYQQLGWQLPVSQLRYWVRGIPDPNQRYRADEHGFQQSGWRLNYPRQKDTDAYLLPTRVIAEHTRLTVTLILRHWDLQPDCDPMKDSTTP